MSIAEFQQLILNAITTGAFVSFIVSSLVIFFGKGDNKERSVI